MTPSAAHGLVQSVHDRLKTLAQQRGRPFAELLELYAVERFLHRLGSTRHRDRLVLKGALVLRHWLGTDMRPTRDVDLLGPVDLDETTLRAILRDVLQAPVVVDGIAFDAASITIRPIRIGSAVLGLRARFDALLGRTRLRYQVDVGLGDSVYPDPVEVVPGDLLGLPVARVRGYTPYSVIAEKLEAVAVLGDANSRVKDYYDLYQLSATMDFDGSVLLESIKRTFSRRATPVPVQPMEGLGSEFAESPLHVARWRAFLSKGSLQVAAADFSAVVAAIRRFSEPVLDAAREHRAFEWHWVPGGPWGRR